MASSSLFVFFNVHTDGSIGDCMYRCILGMCEYTDVSVVWIYRCILGMCVYTDVSLGDTIRAHSSPRYRAPGKWDFSLADSNTVTSTDINTDADKNTNTDIPKLLLLALLNLHWHWVFGFGDFLNSCLGFEGTLWITVKLAMVSAFSLCTVHAFGHLMMPGSKWMIQPFHAKMDHPQTGESLPSSSSKGQSPSSSSIDSWSSILSIHCLPSLLYYISLSSRVEKYRWLMIIDHHRNQ